MTVILGTAGDDRLVGTKFGEGFDVSQGGNDTVLGKGADDVVIFGSTFTADDFVDGGAGDNDAIKLFGDYLLGVTIGSQQIRNVEGFQMGGDFNYSLTFLDSAVPAGGHMSIDAGEVTDGHRLTLNAEAETTASYSVAGGFGSDLILTGGGNDTVLGEDGNDNIDAGGGTNTVKGGAGDDFVIVAGSGQLLHDTIDGGDGTDIVKIDGAYSGGLAFTTAMMVNVEQVELDMDFNYNVDLTHVSAPLDSVFTVDAFSIDPSHQARIDASGLRHYFELSLIGSAGNDTLIGGRNLDALVGGAGADRLTGGPGGDFYQYGSAAESTGAGHDTIVGFDAKADFIDPFFTSTPHQIGGVDPEVITGKLSAANFDTNLAHAIGAGQLAVDHAVLFMPDSGNQAGHLFLIVDANGAAGYQAGDLVVELDSAKNMGHFSAANFSAPA